MDNKLPFFGAPASPDEAASASLYPNGLPSHGNNDTALTSSRIPAVTNDTDASYYYSDGDIITQEWHAVFIFLAYVAAFVGAYSSIRLLEHALWRSERERENASSITSKYPLLSTAFVLGSCAIWSMHFIGMQAVTLDHVDMCHDWAQTAGSLGLSIAGVWAGMILASRDIFSGPDRVIKLKNLLKHRPSVSSKTNRKRASLDIHLVALFHKLHWIASGSVLAALGALSMHYVGMRAMTGPFRKVWSITYVAASVVVGVFVCFVGLWILFRPLHWKVEKSWYRQASAGVIALAVCFLHFLGMLSVTYIADSSQNVGICNQEDVWGWKPDQLMVLCVSMAVPFVAFYIEHTINNELRITYRQLLDIKLTRSEFENSSMRSMGSVGAGRTSESRISGLSKPVAREAPSSAFTVDSGKSIEQRQRDWDQIYTKARAMETGAEDNDYLSQGEDKYRPNELDDESSSTSFECTEPLHEEVSGCSRLRPFHQKRSSLKTLMVDISSALQEYDKEECESEEDDEKSSISYSRHSPPRQFRKKQSSLKNLMMGIIPALQKHDNEASISRPEDDLSCIEEGRTRPLNDVQSIVTPRRRKSLAAFTLPGQSLNDFCKVLESNRSLSSAAEDTLLHVTPQRRVSSAAFAAPDQSLQNFVKSCVPSTMRSRSCNDLVELVDMYHKVAPESA